MDGLPDARAADAGVPAVGGAGAPRARARARGARRWWRAGLRLLGRSLRHPRYALHVLTCLLLRPSLLFAAARRGWRAAMLGWCARLCPEVAALITPYEAGFFGQVFLFDEYEVGRLRLPTAPVVIDVGANVGFFSWRVHACRPRARIVALEPASANWRRLTRVLAALGATAEPLRQACGREAGSAVLFLRNSVTHSLDPAWHRDLDAGAGTETVEVVTLDGVRDRLGLDGVDLLKVDVEGAEVQVLEGARDTLQHTRHVALEYHTPQARAECLAILRAAGFRCREKRFWGVRAGAPGGDEAEGLLLCARASADPPPAP